MNSTKRKINELTGIGRSKFNTSIPMRYLIDVPKKVEFNWSPCATNVTTGYKPTIEWVIKKNLSPWTLDTNVIARFTLECSAQVMKLWDLIDQTDLIERKFP